MSKFARILAVVFLAIFAAGTVAHAAASTDMSLKMSIASMAGEGMADGGAEVGGRRALGVMEPHAHDGWKRHRVEVRQADGGEGGAQHGDGPPVLAADSSVNESSTERI